jgi:hypothetical protein
MPSNDYLSKGCILLLSGWKGSGKDVMAKHLEKRYGYRRLAFADALKDQVADRYGISRYQFDDPVGKEQPLLNYPVKPILNTTDMDSHYKLVYTNKSEKYHTPRSLLILEAALARSIDDNIWARTIARNIAANNLSNIVISDWRYPNEHQLIKDSFPDHKVLSVRINRFDNTDAIDQSERSLDDHSFENILSNESSIDNFKLKIDEFMLDKSKTNNKDSHLLLMSTSILAFMALFMYLYS